MRFFSPIWNRGSTKIFLPGDPQTALSYLGNVVLFVQYALVKFKVCIKIKGSFFSNVIS